MTPHRNSNRLPAIIINDSTLRDSEPAVTLSRKNRIDIARALEQAGMDEIEFGVPASRRTAIDDLAAATAALARAKPTIWGPAIRRTVNVALRAGIGAVHLSVPLSARHLGRAGALGNIRRVTGYACERGLAVTLSAEDTRGADLNLICDVVEVAEASGARRFRYADTTGVLHPLRTHWLFRRLCAETDLELEFRGHDDFGLATANTVAAVQGGATHVSVSALGAHPRSAMASLVEVARAIPASTLHQTHTDFARFPALSALVATITGLPSRPAAMARPVALAPIYAAAPAIAHPAAEWRSGNR